MAATIRKDRNYPRKLFNSCRETLRRAIAFLLFVPHIADLALAEAALRHSFTTFRFATVHASDPERLGKVQKCVMVITTF